MIRFTAKLSTTFDFLVNNSNSILLSFKHGLSQKHCLFCSDTTINTNAICTPCFIDMPWNSHACIQCALPMHSLNTSNLICGECISSPPPFTCAVASFRYQIPVDQAILMLKYKHKRYFAIFFAKLLTEVVLSKYTNKALPTLLIPVPMHRAKQKSRGYNQALLISKQLSKSLSIPTKMHILQKIHATAPQTGLNKRQRMQNLKGAFKVVKSLSGLHIALVDDVMTTRATADLLSKLLIDAGAKRVDIWCIARTPKGRTSI